MISKRAEEEAASSGVALAALGLPSGFSVPSGPVSLGSGAYRDAVFASVPSECVLELEGRFERFSAAVGLHKQSGEKAQAAFRVYVDGRRRAGTNTLSRDDEPDRVSVSLNGAERLALIAEDRSPQKTKLLACWAEAFLTSKERDAAPPELLAPPPDVPPAIEAPIELAPLFHHPISVGGSPGKPFLFRVPVTGRLPLRIRAKGLPEGLRLDSELGVLRGIPDREGVFLVSLEARNPWGVSRSKLVVRICPDGLAMTPPMGWNSWNVWGCSVDQSKALRSAEALVELGLASRGFRYVVVDDCWMGERDDAGRLRPNDRFPDMAGLADEIHGRGLKLGLYSSPGPFTCQGYPGSYLHEREDALALALWGVDFLKYDWCSYQDLLPEFNRTELMRPFLRMRRALDLAKRDVVYSVCQYGMGAVWEWGDEVGAHLWRTTGDISDTWSSVEGIGFSQNGKERWAGPGHWNDPDMLVLGRVGWGRDPWDTRLTRNEQMTHMTLWSLLAAPLFLGCDLEELDAFTLSLLRHEEVLAVDQDPLGRQASRREREGLAEVWARPLWDGTLAVGLFNRGWLPTKVTARWEALGLTGREPVRDLWLRKDLGRFEGSFATMVPRHGAALLKVGEPEEDYEALAAFLRERVPIEPKGVASGRGTVSPGLGSEKGTSLPSFQ